VEIDYTIAERDGTLVQKDDRRFLLSTLNITSVAITDKLIVSSVTLDIVNVKPLSPAGTVQFYEVQCRG
jgi:hypothetical protein